MDNRQRASTSPPDKPPSEHLDRRAYLTTLANALNTYYERRGNLEDLDDAISSLQNAVALTPDDNPYKAHRLDDLGSAHFSQRDRREDLLKAISIQEKAVEFMPDENQQKLTNLNGLGRTFLARFDHFGRIEDLESAMSSLEKAVELTPDGHPRQSHHLHDLGNALLVRFKRLDKPEDLEQSISILERACELMPDGNPDKPDHLSSLGVALLVRFERHGSHADLERAISLQQQADALMPDRYTSKPSILSSHGKELRVRYERARKPDDLNIAISSLEKAVELTPGGHLNKSKLLTDLVDGLYPKWRSPNDPEHRKPPSCDIWAGIYLDHGAIHEEHFRSLRRLEGLENAISDYQKAAELIEPSHDVCRSTVLRRLEAALWVYDKEAAKLWPNDRLHPVRPYKLGDAFLERFDRFGRLEDLDSAISNLRKSVDFAPDGHPEKPAFLSRLAHALDARFKRLDSLQDLDSAISTLQKAVEVTPDGHPDKPAIRSCLKHAVEARLKPFSPLKAPFLPLSPTKTPHPKSCLPPSHVPSHTNLESAIPIMQKAIELTSDNHPEKPYRLIIIGDALQERFGRVDTETDMESAISNYQKAVDLTPDHHSAKPSRLVILGDALRSRFERYRNREDLDRATSIYQTAVDLTPADHPSELSPLNILAEMGRLVDLDSKASALRRSIRSLLDGHPDKPARLIALGMTLQVRFERFGKFEDLENAISTLRRADGLTADNHPNKPLCHYSLGDAHRVRFERLGKPEDLEKAISRLQKSVKFVPSENPQKPTYLNGLGRALLARSDHYGRIEDLESAMSNLEKAVELTPDGHPRQPHHLHDLGNALQLRFKRLNKPEDLEKSISILQRASELAPDDHPDKPIHLSSLGVALLARFERDDSHADLERAISIQQKADALMPDHHTSKPSILSNRGKALRARYERARKLDDLNTAMSGLRKAAELTPDDHPDNLKRLIGLAVELQERFERLGSLADLDSLISSLRMAVALMEGHPDQPLCSNALGKAYRTRYERRGNPEDLESAISNLQKAVARTPDDNPYKAHRLDNLGSAHFLSFSDRDSSEDLQNAISIQEKAVKLTPSGHPNESKFLISYGNALYTSSNSLRDPEHRKSAVEAFTKAAKSAVGHPRKCFDAALKWAQCCRDSSESALDAYTCAIGLLPRIAPLGLGVADQHALLVEVGGVARDAVAAAIEDREHITALEWAEHGRSIVWQNLLSLRAPLEDLRLIHPGLADRLQEISQQMETPFNDAGLGSAQDAQPTEAVARTHLELAEERDKILKEIRSQPNFESFLRPKTFNKLNAAAHEGTVVVLNVQDSRCDALALVSDEYGVSVKNIPLKRFSYQAGQTLLQELKSVLSSAGLLARGPRKPKIATDPRTGIDFVLRVLWLDVVKPVMEGLRYEVELTNPPHIWWCPTGPLAFLPIHAAGLYNQDAVGEKVSDYVVSSYTPTLAAILEQKRRSGGSFSLLTVALPLTPYASALPATKAEVGCIRSLATGLSLVELMGESATVKRVVEEMHASDWVHLACHGEQVIPKAMASGLLLHDKKLELSEMIKMSLPKADFAFLSACQTAVGDETVAEESVHLASGMLFAGYRGLVATMWSINDKDAPQVAEDVYRQILKGGKPNRKEAARALHVAVKRLREESKGDLLSWVPFIHIGR